MGVIDSIKKRMFEEESGEELLKEIDWKGLETHVSDVLDVKITIKPILAPGRANTYIKWESAEELIDNAGVFKAALTSVKVGSFSVSSISEVVEQRKYWCTVHLFYTHKGGGTNGASIFNAIYALEKKVWEFKEAR